MSAEDERECLGYILIGTEGDIGSWGHEYVRNLAGEILQEYTKRQSEKAPVDDLMELVQQIVAFHLKVPSWTSFSFRYFLHDLHVFEEYPNALQIASFLDNTQDKLMIVPSDSTTGSSGNWLFKNKEHGKTSAAASLGMIQLLDVDSGLSQLDKYFHSNDNPIIAGALVGVGIVN